MSCLRKKHVRHQAVLGLTFFMLEATTAKIYDFDGAFGRMT
jgi:hypothetical protein